MFSCLHSLVKTSAKFVRILEQVKMRLGFSLICSRILPNVRLGFHQVMMARKKCFISYFFIFFIYLSYFLRNCIMALHDSWEQNLFKLSFRTEVWCFLLKTKSKLWNYFSLPEKKKVVYERPSLFQTKYLLKSALI